MKLEIGINIGMSRNEIRMITATLMKMDNFKILLERIFVLIKRCHFKIAFLKCSLYCHFKMKIGLKTIKQN